MGYVAYDYIYRSAPTEYLTVSNVVVYLNSDVRYLDFNTSFRVLCPDTAVTVTAYRLVVTYGDGTTSSLQFPANAYGDSMGYDPSKGVTYYIDLKSSNNKLCTGGEAKDVSLTVTVYYRFSTVPSWFQDTRVEVFEIVGVDTSGDTWVATLNIGGIILEVG